MATNVSDISAAVSRPKLDAGLIAVIGIAMFVTTFDITAITMIMPRIKEDMALDVGGFAWLMDGYSLPFVVFLMTAGVLADRYGRRRGLLIGNAVFLAASLLCVVSNDFALLIAGRIGQGIGSAFIVCSGLAIITHRYVDPAERGRVFGLIGTISGASMALGPAGGGVIADLFGWHWVFLLNVPICLFIGLGALRVVMDSKDPGQRRIDVPGVVTLSMLLVSMIWLLLHGPRVGSIEVPMLVALLGVAALAVTFVAIQRRSSHPVLQVKLFTQPAFVGVCVVPLALSVAYWAVLIYLPLFLEQRLGTSLTTASYLMLAATLPMVVLPIYSTRVAQKLPTHVFFAAGLSVVAIGGFVIAAGAEMQSLTAALIGMAVAGTGTAILNPQMVSKIVGAVPREQAGAAAAITVILRQGGFAIGIALLGSVLRTLEGSSVLPVIPYSALFLVAGATAALSAALVFALTKARAS